MTVNRLNPIRVSCAIILRDGKVLAAQRSASMSLPLKWEFPGGKVQANESDEECLHRELWEELKIIVSIKKKLTNNEYDYGSFQITLVPFIVQYVGGSLTLLEHSEARWLSKSDLTSLDWAPADIPILIEVLQQSFIK